MAVETFSTEAAGRIAGPEWLRSRRLSSATAALEAPLPTPEAEEWRYSRIAELDLSRYHLLDPGDDAPGVPPIVESLVSALGELSGLVVLHNGRSAGIDVLGAAAEAGVTVGSPDAADLLGLTDEPVDLFAAYNDAFAADPIVIDIPRNTDLDLPLAVVSFIDAEGAAVFPRVVVRAGENSSVQVIEVSFSTDVSAFVAPVTEIAVGPAARVRYAAMQDLGPRVWQLGSFSAEVGQDATLDAAVAALGGDYGRLRLDCRLVGRGATGNLSSVYFGDGHQMLDLRTFQEHRAPDTTSNLLFKGAVADDSHAVYTGLIRIKPEARGTNAFQTNRNLKLSPDAWAESVPNLEIENNDVRCSHASTVGPVDEDQRFYLESRGVPTQAAERLIVGGFFDEVVDDFAVPALGPLVRGRIDELLERKVGPRLAVDGDAAQRRSTVVAADGVDGADGTES